MPMRPPVIQKADTRVDIYNAFRRLADGMTQTQQGFASILRGEAPDGSGAPLIDSGLWFYKPGLPGNQLAYGGTANAGKLTFSSTSNGAKGFINFGYPNQVATVDEANARFGLGTAAPAVQFHLVAPSVATMVRLEPPTFDIPSCTTTNGSPTVTCTGVPPSAFAPSGGPRIVPGMIVTGTGIPANTRVKHLTSGTVLTLTNNASASGTVTLTFQTYVDIAVVSDESGRDVSWQAFGAVRFVPGGIAQHVFRVDGDTLPIATNVADSARVFLEAGYISGGSAIGGDLQIGGPGHGELGRLYLETRVLYIFRNPASGTNSAVGIQINPAEFGAGFGFDNNVTIKQTQGNGSLCLIGSGSTSTILSILPTGSDSGTSPNKTISYSSFLFKWTNDAKFYCGNATGGGVIMQGFSNAVSFTNVGTGLNMLTLNIGIASWSDSAVSNAWYLGDNTGTSAKRVWFSCAGNGVLDRFGVSSVYHLITNAQAGNANFLAPSAAPEVLRIVHTSTGNAASIVLRIDTNVALTAGTGKHLAVFASNGNELFSVGADGSTANATVRFGRTSDTGYNEISGGSAPVWRSSVQNTVTGANTILFTLVTANWFTDSLPAEGMRFGDTRSGVRRGFICGQGGASLDRFGISAGYFVVAPTNSTNMPTIVGTEIFRVVNDTVNGGDTRIPVRIDTLRTGQTANLLDIVSAVTGSQTFFVDNKGLLACSIRSDSFFVDVTDPTKKLAFALQQITTGTTRTVTHSDISGQNILDTTPVFIDDEIIAFEDEVVFYP